MRILPQLKHVLRVNKSPVLPMGLTTDFQRGVGEEGAGRAQFDVEPCSGARDDTAAARQRATNLEKSMARSDGSLPPDQ